MVPFYSQTYLPKGDLTVTLTLRARSSEPHCSVIFTVRPSALLLPPNLGATPKISPGPGRGSPIRPASLGLEGPMTPIHGSQ